MNLNKIDKSEHNRPGGICTTREPPRITEEYPIEILVVFEEKETKPVDYHYHFEDKGDELELAEAYKLVEDDHGGSVKQELPDKIENEHAIEHIKRRWSGRWNKVLDGNGDAVVEINSDY